MTTPAQRRHSGSSAALSDPVTGVHSRVPLSWGDVGATAPEPSPLSPSVTRTLLSHVGDTEVSERRRLAAQRLAALTAREREVAGAVGAGASNAEIATTLFMSEATVKAHVSRLFTKLDEVANRVQIAIIVHDAEQA